MKGNKLNAIVVELLEKGKEGAYWDFKQEWHAEIQVLLKDIVCFTNTVHDYDCYIIFGVSDALEIVGMKGKRRKQADIIDALDKLSFASVHIPQISVETVVLEKTELDVLIIFNTAQTPVYLKKTYGKMLAGCIYSRNEDRNTPDNGNAELEQIEYLWKKRFGLTKPALRFIFDHLENKHEWNELNGKYYNVYRPEYLLKIYDGDETGHNSDVSYGYNQTNERMSFEMLDIIANNTVIYTHQLAVLDSGRLSVSIPESGYIYRDDYHQSSIAYKYYIKGSDTYKLLEFLYTPENMEQRWALSKHMEVVLSFESKEEKDTFETFCRMQVDKIDNYIKDNYESVSIYTDSKQKTRTYIEQILAGKCLNILLKEFRQTDVKDG